jgi:hypothetical protein
MLLVMQMFEAIYCNRKVTGSSPYEVIDFSNISDPSSRTRLWSVVNL